MSDEQKVAEVQQKLFQDVYIPAFVQLFNKKAEAAGMTKISSAQELEQALNLTAFIESQREQQGSSIMKAAGALQQVAQQNPQNQQQTKEAAARQFAQAVAQNPELLEQLKKLQ